MTGPNGTAGWLESCPFHDLTLGARACCSRTLEERDIRLFALATGDLNPVHLDPEFARNSLFRRPVAHGMWTAALISAVLGTRMPGPGTIYLSQSLRFVRPVFPGETITAWVEVRALHAPDRRVELYCEARNGQGRTVLTGAAEVIAPAARQQWRTPTLEGPP